jgi:hypothetical protein
VSGSRRREKPGLYVSRPMNFTTSRTEAAERRKKDLHQLHYCQTCQHSWAYDSRRCVTPLHDVQLNLDSERSSHLHLPMFQIW